MTHMTGTGGATLDQLKDDDGVMVALDGREYGMEVNLRCLFD